MAGLKDFPKTCELRDGSVVIIRPLDPSDEEALMQFFKALPESERVWYRDDVTDPAVMHRWTHNINLERVVPLIAVQEGRIIANWTLHVRDHGWTRHHGQLRGTVLPHKRNVGLASIMVHALLGLASNYEVERLVIELVPEQQAVSQVFQSIGFRIDAVLKNWVKDFKGRYNDMYLLSMQLEPAWKKMEELIYEYGTHGG